VIKKNSKGVHIIYLNYERKSICPGAMEEVNFKTDLLNGNDYALFEDVFYVKFSKPWLIRANNALKKSDYFEGMIYLWVIFNSWLSSICKDYRKAETDRYLVESAGWDDSLRNTFEQRKQDDPDFLEHIQKFVSIMPVFKNRAIRNLKIDPWDGDEDTRNLFRDKLFRQENEGYLNKKDYAPHCYREHNVLPGDWAHVLRAIYAVRCDLFHGGKSFLYYGDKVFVELAFKILWTAWGEEQLKRCQKRQ